jgi:hypothetical protein
MTTRRLFNSEGFAHNQGLLVIGDLTRFSRVSEWSFEEANN